MTTQQAIIEIGHKAATARNPIEYIEKQATQQYFAELTKYMKTRFPEHDLWKNKELKSYRFKDGILTTMNGSILAIRGIN